MKLLKRLKRVEEKLSGRNEFEKALAAGATIGVVWTRDSGAAPERELGPGERLVEDLVLEGQTAGAERAHTTPRVTRDPEDHGVVYDEQLRRIGRVVSRKGGGRLIEWE
jgi:hypothetical protein